MAWRLSHAKSCFVVSRLPMRLLAKNAVWIFAGQGVSFLVQAGYFILLARLLGAYDYGLYVSVVAFVSVGSQFGTLGSGYVLLRYASMDQTLYAQYWGSVLLSVITAGTVVVALLTLLGILVLPDAPIPLILIVAISDTMLGGLVQCAGQVFQTFEQMSKTALISLSTNLMRLLAAGGLYLTFGHSTPMIWAAAVLCVSGIVAVVSVVLTTRRFGKPTFSAKLLVRHTGEGAIFAVSSSTTSIYNDLDKIMMGHLGMNFANGVYTLAYRAINLANVPVFAIHAAAFPRFFQQGHQGVAATLPLARRLQIRTAMITIVLALTLFLSAPLIPILTNRSYTQSVAALRILCIIPFFRSFQWSAGDALSGAGLQKLRLILQACAGFFNLCANLYLIPRYSWHGAAWSSLATDGGLALSSWILYFFLVVKRPKLTGPQHREIASDLAFEA
ncbi:MAG: flippase [Terracidiphilus sp.]